MSTRDMFKLLESIDRDAVVKKIGEPKTIKVKEGINAILTSKNGVKADVYHPRKKD